MKTLLPFLLLTSSIALAQTNFPPLDQTEIKGLLVFQLDNGSFASQASQMNATVVPASSEKNLTLLFNQEVGPMMVGATQEVEKFMRLRHKENLDSKTQIEFAFANKHSPKDGPSAAVVCSLMAESILSGKKIDPSFAATGDMTATGIVQPVGGVSDKIRGAIEKRCNMVAIPKSNETSISDTYILKGIAPLYQIQILSLETFDDAQKIALLDRDPEVQEALDEFAKIQTVLKKNPKYITNGKVREKLRGVYNTLPNHLSAKYLLLHSANKGPRKLSLLGSLNGIEEASNELSIMIDNDSYKTRGGGDDVLRELIIDLHRIRPQIDKRLLKYADANRDLAQFIDTIRGRKNWNTQLEREMNETIARVTSERDRLRNDQAIQEELNGE